MKHRFLKRVITTLILLILICNSVDWNGMTVHGAEINGELEVLMNQSEGSMEVYLDEFKKKYPNVKLKYVHYSDYETEIHKRIESGDYGDVILVPSSITSAALPKYFEKLGSAQELRRKYNYLEQSKQNGDDIYGLPSYAYLCGMLYNKEVFDKAGISSIPKSIDEFLEDMSLIQQHTDAIPLYTNYNAPWATTFWEYFSYIEMTGNPGYKFNAFLYEENPYQVGSTHYQVFQLLYDLVAQGYTEEPTKSDWESCKTMLNEGKIGCVAIGSWALDQIKNAGSNGKNVGIMPFPNEVNDKQYMTVLTDYCYAISKNSDNKEAARAFIDFMLEESGYALDRSNLSIMRTDPYPDTFDDLQNVVMVSNLSASDNAYNDYTSLRSKLDLENPDETLRVIEAASGMRNESFDEIMDDWNERWESSRTPEMKKDIGNVIETGIPVFMDNSEVMLTDVEEEYIDEHRLMRVGYLRNMAPFSYEKDGVFVGVANELCERISENTGFTMEYHGYDTLNDMVTALKNGEVDILAGVEEQDNPDIDIRCSKEYIEYMNVLVKHETVEANDMNGMKAAYVLGGDNGYWDEVDNKTGYNNIRECIESIQSRKTDYTITNFYSASYYTKEAECENTVLVPSADSGSLHMGFSGDVDSTLLAICNKCIYGIPAGTMQIALQKYMEPEAGKITVQKFIETNPMLCIIVISSFFMVAFIFIIIVMLEKDRSNRKHAIDVKKYELLSSLADEYMFEYDCNEDKLTFDKKFQDAFGFEKVFNRKKYNGANKSLNEFLDHLNKVRNKEVEQQTPFSLEKDNGEVTWYRLMISSIDDNKGQHIHLIGKMTNIQSEMEEVQNYQNKAERDPLTGLYNRTGFYSQTKENAYNVLFAVLDIDNFKSVNDTLGHEGGDYVLNCLADTMKRDMGDNAILGRFGGDEFMVMLYDTTEEEAHTKLRNLVSDMNTIIQFEHKEHHVSISVGALYCKEVSVPENLFKEADAVLYETKEAGKNGYRLKIS